MLLHLLGTIGARAFYVARSRPTCRRLERAGGKVWASRAVGFLSTALYSGKVNRLQVSPILSSLLLGAEAASHLEWVSHLNAVLSVVFVVSVPALATILKRVRALLYMVKLITDGHRL